MTSAVSIGAAFLAAWLCATPAHASDPVAVYARVDKVVLEPDTDSPQMIQVWGVFAMAKPDDRNDYLTPARGYLYSRWPATAGRSRGVERSEAGGRDRADRRLWQPLFFTDYSLGLLGLRDGPMKFIDELRSGRAQLFDVREDPDERRNVAGAHAEQVGEYERTLRNWSAAQKQTIRAASAAR